MNQVYRVIWNKIVANWMVVAESVSACGKSRSRTAMPAGDVLGPHICSGNRACKLRLLVLPLLVCTAWQSARAQPPSVNALPTGGAVSAGQATISQAGNQMQILQNSDKAALNWQSFNIGSSAGVTFQQPSSQSVALNRVAGNDPSQIFGTLSANGRLILINPNGVVFGAGSRVDAAGLIATTKALSDADFMNNQYHFQGGGSGVVRNDGTIIAAPDGMILLIADQVINTGTMQVSGGTIGMVSADELQVSADWKTVNVVQPSVANINDVTVENFGRIDASGVQGGRIELQGGQGTVQSEGELLAVGEQGNGGSIHLSGMQVGLMQGSLTNASGATGGGDVLIGGDWQGSGSMTHASATYMDADAVILANATVQGNGGKAVLWSDGYTNFRGQIQANGAGSGNGGQVETSGKDILDATGEVMAQGLQAGSWLLDPSNVTISTTGAGSLTGGTYNPATSGTISNTAINTALNAGTSVTISTGGGSGGNGVIMQEAGADINMTGNSNPTLTMVADRIIDLQGNISATGTGGLTLVMDASGGSGLTSGAIIVRGDLITNGGSVSFRSGAITQGSVDRKITTAGGNVTFSGDLEITGPFALLIDTATGAANGGGAVFFYGKVDAADTYSFLAAGGNWNSLQTAATSGIGTNTGDTFMAQPQSELENSVVNYTSGFRTIALAGTYNNGAWRWTQGSHVGQSFNASRDSVSASTLPNGDSAYVNWTANEPDTVAGSFVYLSADANGKWRGLQNTSPIAGTVVQKVSNKSSLTINAGDRTVYFTDRVGSLKPLSLLTVNGTAAGSTIISGKQVTTALAQVYNNRVQIGNTSLLLESTNSSIISQVSLSYNPTAPTNLIIRAGGNINLNGPVTSLSNGTLTVTLTADTTNTGAGSITTNGISTSGGSITMTASSGITLNGGALDTGAGTGGNISLRNNQSGNIVATAGGSMNAGGANIDVTNGAAGGVTGGGSITLESLSGGRIGVTSNVTDLTAGTDAITLNGTTTGSGTVGITSQSGDILVDDNVTSAATGNLSAIVLGAGRTKLAGDSSGGNVKLNNSTLVTDPTSRAIIYTGSIDDSTGIGSAGAGYPGVGNYRYNVVYNDISRLPTGATGTFVQYREQPTLTVNITTPSKIYDAVALNALDWTNYSATTNGWQNGDTAMVNPLKGDLSFNGNPAATRKDVAVYTVGLGTLSDTLGYKLDISGTPTYEISTRHITIGDLVVGPRQYNGTTDAVITGGTIIGLAPADVGNVTLNGTHGLFVDKNVGQNKPVLVARVDLSGPGSTNYTPDFLGSTTTGTITPAELRLSGIHPLDRVYDGTTNATFTGTPTLSGIFASDVGNVSAPLEHISGRFANKNAGSNKEVVEDLSTAILFGSEKDNYVLAGVDSTVNSATIFPAPLQLIGVSTTKMFDGVSDAFTSATVTGLMPGDNVGDVRQYFNSITPGKSKRLSILSDFAIFDGNDGNNYQIIDDELLATGEIKPIPTISGTGGNQVAPASTNENLLAAHMSFGDIRQKFEQADYFLHPGNEPRHSSTHATSVPVNIESP